MGEQPVFAAGEEEQQAFELDMMLEHDCESPVTDSGAVFFVRSRLTVEQAFFVSAIVWSDTEDSSVACVVQQEGSPKLSISVQRHSARSRAAFHCAKERCIPERGVDRASSPGLVSAFCVIEACAMALRHFSAYDSLVASSWNKRRITE